MSGVRDSSMPSQKVLAKKVTVKPKDAMANMSSAFISLMVYAQEKGAKPTGPPFTIYHKREEEFEMEFCLPIGSDVPETKGVVVKNIEFKKTKAVTVKGNYGELEDAYDDLEEAAKNTMPKIEIYVKGPKDTKKADDYETICMIPYK